MRQAFFPALLTTLVFGHVTLGQSAPAPAPTLLSESTALPPSARPAEAVAPCACDAGVCGPNGQMWAEAEYLLWWVRGTALPPLVTTSPAGTSQIQAGVPATPGAAVLFAGSTAN